LISHLNFISISSQSHVSLNAEMEKEHLQVTRRQEKTFRPECLETQSETFLLNGTTSTTTSDITLRWDEIEMLLLFVVVVVICCCGLLWFVAVIVVCCLLLLLRFGLTIEVK